MIIKQQTANPLQLITIKADTDILPFRFINAKGGLCASSENPVGVSETSWNMGDSMSVISYGVVLIEILDAINTGEKVSVSNNAGKACKKTESSDWVGTAISPGSAGSIIKIKLVV